MRLEIAPNGVLQIDDARITHRNFAGEEGMYNRKGDRNFSLVIPTEEMKDLLLDDVNEAGCAWNVKIKAPREEGDTPFMFLPVKVKFNDRGPIVHLISGRNRRELSEDEIGMLDRIDISRIDLDIAPSDGEVNGKPYRTAYLRSMEVVQNVDRFTARYMDERYED